MGTTYVFQFSIDNQSEIFSEMDLNCPLWCDIMQYELAKRLIDYYIKNYVLRK